MKYAFQRVFQISSIPGRVKWGGGGGEEEHFVKMFRPRGTNPDFFFLPFFSPTLLKDIVSNKWWGCGHKNTEHYFSFRLCECTESVRFPSVWQTYTAARVHAVTLEKHREDDRECGADTQTSNVLSLLTANNNTMKHWAEVKKHPKLSPSCLHLSLPHCLIKYSINYECLCRVPIAAAKAFSFPP